MDILRNIIMFSGKSLVFSGLISFVGLILSWVLYKYVVIRVVSVKKALFENDNFAAWLEFVGAFVLPVFYLSAKAIDLEISSYFGTDLLYGLVFVVFYTFLFTFMRILSGWTVYFIAGDDEGGKVNLYKEVYEQQNIAASLFSISFALIFVNMLSNLKLASISDLMNSSLRSMEILVLTMLFSLIYILVIRRKSLLKEIFVHNNTAAGIGFLGFIMGVQIILNAAVNYSSDFITIDIVILAVIGFAVLLIISYVSRLLYSKILKVNILEELYDQNNAGAAFGELALFIGISMIIANFF